MIDKIPFKVLAILIAVILLFIIPTFYMFERQNDIIYSYVFNETNAFIDRIRNIGYINKQAYEEFINKIENTGYTYEIEIEHKKKLILPDLSNPGQYIITYESFYNYDILNDVIYNMSLTDRTYKLAKGDFIFIKIRNTNKTKAEIFKSKSNVSAIFVRLGGMCSNASY